MNGRPGNQVSDVPKWLDGVVGNVHVDMLLKAGLGWLRYLMKCYGYYVIVPINSPCNYVQQATVNEEPHITSWASHREVSLLPIYSALDSQSRKEDCLTILRNWFCAVLLMRSSCEMKGNSTPCILEGPRHPRNISSAPPKLLPDEPTIISPAKK